MLAQVRVGALYSNGLLLTDSQLFDGIELLLLGPAGLRWILGMDLRRAVSVSLRARTAAESLELMRARADFYWQTKDPAVIPPGFSVEDICRLQDEWARAIDRGEVGSQCREASLSFASAFSDKLMELLPSFELVSADAHAELRAELEATGNRSEALELLDDYPDSHAAWQARTWWENAYFDVIARQHRGVWWGHPGIPEEVRLSPAEVGAPEEKKLPRRARLDQKNVRVRSVPGALVRLIGDLSQSDFASAHANARPYVSRHYEKPSWTGRAAVALLVSATQTETKPIAKMVVEVVALLLWLALVLITVLEGFNLASASLLVLLSGFNLLLEFPWQEARHLASFASAKNRVLIRNPIG